MNRDTRVTPVIHYLFAGLALALFLTSAPSWAVCTAGNPNGNVAEATPSADFTVPGDGTVTHHAKTGLMWKQCTEGLSGAACATGADTVMNWSNALAAAESSTFAGYTDWRLPNSKELNSIVETCGYSPSINQTLFPATLVAFFWSASTAVPAPAYVWSVYFYDGGDNLNGKSSGGFARLVRGGQSFDSFDAFGIQADSTPDPFSFTAQTGVVLSAETTSNIITVAGINSASPISIVGGTYMINSGVFTSAAGTVNNGDIVTLRQTSSASHSTPTTATLTIGGVSGAFNVTTLAAVGSVPNAFSFTAQTGVARSTQITSNIITVSGLNIASPISIVGGEYSINGGTTYISAGSNVINGQTVRVRQASSANFFTLTPATLTIGGVSGAFNVTTLAADTVPNAFSFTAQTGVPRATPIYSNIITVSGINIASPISIVGGTYSINGGITYTDQAGSVTNGQTVRVIQAFSSSSFFTLTPTTLTIGGVSGAFNVTTLAADVVPSAFSFTAQTGAPLSTLIASNTITVSGINTASSIAISVGGEYSIDGGTYTNVAGNVTNGQAVRVRQTTSANFFTLTPTILTIGGVNGAFNVTTLAADVVPSAFSFTAQTGVPLSTLRTSNTIAVLGINTSSPISISVGGEYSIDGGATYTSLPGNVTNGQTVRVRRTSSANFFTLTTTTLTIGGVNRAFNVTTLSQ